MLAALPLAPRIAAAQTPTLIDLPSGGVRFLPGSTVFAGGVVAAEGFEIVHALYVPWLPLQAGFAAVEAHLRSVGRPIVALCGLELRLPRQLSVDGFRAFNQPYVDHLTRWGLISDGRNPVCRTNVAPALGAPTEPMLHGFSYTVPATSSGRTFVMSGMTELGPGGSPVAAGDTSRDGMDRKIRFVLDAVTRRIADLGFGWRDVSHVDFYAAAAVDDLITSLLFPVIGAAAGRGLRWHYGRPPVEGVEVELEARSVRGEQVVTTR